MTLDDRRVELVLEAHVAVRDDADDLVAVRRTGTPEMPLARVSVDDLADRRVGP